MSPLKFIDLSHTLQSDIPTWDNSCGFKVTTTLNHADCTTNTTFCVQQLSMHAGIGTHMDAPAHCIVDGKTISDFTLQELYLPCHTLDLSAHATHPEYQISVKDITTYEALHGTINPHSFVLLYTGWSRLWNDAPAYRNNLTFPTLSLKAAQLLIEHSVSVVGIDTLSLDLPSTFEQATSAHKLLLGAGIPIVENIANAQHMPALGSYILIAPLKVQGGTEAPSRLIGMIP